MQAAASDDVLIRREGRAGRITMNRPAALNALTLGMVRKIWAALTAWVDDPAVHLVLLDGAGGKALCAGGDVRSLYDSRTQGSALPRAFWSEEYPLNALIGRYPKPYVALQDGIVMGGGIGLSGHARHRIVTERSRLAMPETGIGLIPDVGGTWLLAHAPGEAGIYLGLTGEAMGAADAIHARFADVLVPSARLPELVGPSGGRQGRSGRGCHRVIGAEARASTVGRAERRDRSHLRRCVGRGHAGEACGNAGGVGAENGRGAGAEIAEISKAHSGRDLQRAHPRVARGGAERGVSLVRAPVRGRRVRRGRARAAGRQGPQAQVVAAEPCPR